MFSSLDDLEYHLLTIFGYHYRRNADDQFFCDKIIQILPFLNLIVLTFTNKRRMQLEPHIV